MTLPLSGKTALVTGGAKRIGKAIALELAAAGADVAITYRDSAADADGTLAELLTFGGRALAVRCELTDPNAITAMIALVTSYN